jgi:predicted metal-dependent hydrolase
LRAKERAAPPPGIHRRSPDFGLTPDLPRYWHSGDPYITHFFNGLSLMFPEGERFFMDAVQYFQDRITDRKLREDVRGFLGQEASHGREHGRYNEILAAQGYPTEAIESCVRRGIQIAWLFPLKWQLALTCALEHFTAVFTDSMLRDPRMLRDAHPAFARLWRWHALEEIEHKSVAFDVLRETHPSYVLRIAGFAIATLFLAFWTFAGTRMLLRQDGIGRRAARAEGLRLRRVTKAQMERALGEGIRAYLRRDFHPDQKDDSALARRGLVAIGEPIHA